MATRIEWTHRPGTKGETWNPVAGCTKVSPACDSCYALSMSWRIQNMKKRPKRYNGVVRAPVFTPDTLQWTGRINLDYDELDRPYRWQKERTVFVGSMSDIFHPKVPEIFLVDMFTSMAMNPQHTFLVLTKRAHRMQRLLTSDNFSRALNASVDIERHERGIESEWCGWPLPNVWPGVTAENQEWFDKRVPKLLQIPAPVLWVSVEPMLSAIQMHPEWMPYPDDEDYAAPEDYSGYRLKIRQILDWVVIGGESGPNARRMEALWVLDLMRQCDKAGTAVFVKQLSEYGLSKKISKDPEQWMPELRRREWPK